MTAAGPAVWAAFIAPKSQPEPMIEPMLAKSRPTLPTWRLSLCSSWAGSVLVDVDMEDPPRVVVGVPLHPVRKCRRGP